MKHFLLCTLAIVALVATAWADDEKKDEKKKKAPAPVTFRSLTMEVSKVQRALATKYNAAKTEEEKQEIVEQYNQVPGTFADRFLKFAEENADDAGAFDALVFVVANDLDGKFSAKAIPAIMAKHLEDPKMMRVCQQLARSSAPGAKELLQGVIDKSKNVDLQGYALYGLAKATLTTAEGRDEQAEAMLARVVKDYAKVSNGTLAKTAERDLFEAQNLSIGCEAPQITAEDIDGVEFSLTDYRGKVVVLDFWGDW